MEDDLGFPTNLQELPEVFELTLDADTLSPFGELPELAQAESLDELTAEFVDPMVSLEELDKLDARQENITKLNLASGLHRARQYRGGLQHPQRSHQRR